ncbi:inverse autotransporter beta domain-containing protein [Pantoea ananatis]|uniref:Ig-like domain-containing protein n=1 Tax=Pantoea ananas TaxID=553 RepID=UPI00158EE2E0|nr:Ig-like domain-containing protein [Pantoea ananatis]MBA4823871.1 inverse autotransporter beta domain-containing protein [Pantoea ananatis]QKV86009.1 inverse autotransporter beta domain-containing protein [Pantoea ananatis]
MIKIHTELPNSSVKKDVSPHVCHCIWPNVGIYFAFLIALVVAFTSLMAGAEPMPAANAQRTQVYTLGAGETVVSVEKKYHLTHDQLHQLNKSRTFLHSLNDLQPGDEVDVPLISWKHKKAASPSASETRAEEDEQAKKVAEYASQTGSFLTDGAKREAAELRLQGMATSQAGAALQQWLSHFGTARVQLNMDRRGNWSHSNADLLVPLYDDCQSLLFMQGGIRKPSDRLTGNLGYGVRTFWQNGWMFGGNVFYDNDFTGHNRRIGVGAEAWRDYLRLSANAYLGTTNWHNSRDFDGSWQEKPADGCDVRVEGWLPAYPQLGGKLVWEQYSGKQVALFDKDHLQQNPHAFTASLEYTPVPLITLGAEQRQGRGQHDFQVGLGVNWSFGHDWRWQLAPENVQTMRTLAGSRYELVNRNNEIVLQYRKNPKQDVAHLLLTPVTDNSPADGISRNILQVLATNTSGQPVRNATINWFASSLDASVNLAPTSSVTDENGLATVTLTSTQVQTVTVTAQSNSISAKQNSHFVTVAVSKITLDVLQDNAVADGSSADTVVATLTDSNGRPAAGQKVTWTLPDKVSMNETSSTSDNSGKATVHLTATAAGSAAISATTSNLKAEGMVHFTGNSATARIGTLVVITDGSPADGKTANVAQAMVTDQNGNPLSGQSITWKADKSTATFAKSALTDSSGRTSVSYTDTAAESLTLIATLENGYSATAPSLFVADNITARIKDLTVSRGAKASGNDKNTATATIIDASGNPLRNRAVTFSVTGSAKLSAAIINTDSRGQALVTLTDTVAETVQVTAKLSSGSSLTKESSFVTDLDSAVLSVTATTGALADGRATNRVTVMLKDKNGIALAGQNVTLRGDGSAKFSAASGITDRNGLLQVTLTDTVAETVVVTAALSNGKTAAAQTAFTTYSVTALSASTTSVKVGGSDESILTATVKDSSGAVVANTPVAFTVTGSAKLSAALINTDSSGQAQTRLSDKVPEKVTITAKAKNSSSDGGKTQDVTFTSSITGIGVQGTTHKFAVDQGFPQTGFSGAKMYFFINNSTSVAKKYTWTSNRKWVDISTDGIITLNGDDHYHAPPASERQVTITGTPKGGGAILTYSFTVQKWYLPSETPGSCKMRYGESCYVGCGDFKGGILESASDMSDGAVSTVGKFFGEWRDSPGLEYSYYYDADTLETWSAKKGENFSFIYKTGETGAEPFIESTVTICRVPFESGS